jgi:hypothetical protein
MRLLPFLFQECPGGIVQEETFKEIYAKFFPHGSKQSFTLPSTWRGDASVFSFPLLLALL